MTAEAETDAEHFEAILSAAHDAAPKLAATSRDDRARWLTTVADGLDAAAEQLVPLAQEETALAEARLRGELTRTTFQLRFFGEVLRDGGYLGATVDSADPDWPMGARPDVRRMLRPVGPVAVYAASNFPFAFSVAGGDTASAIAAGTPVVVKANPGHPRLSRVVARIVAESLGTAGAPPGTFALVEGLAIGRSLVLDPRILAAAFTGSLGGGRALFDLAAGRPTPIPFYGELGSVNPAFATPRADAARADEIARGFIGSVYLGAGQFCTKPGFLLVPQGSAIPAIARQLAEATPAAPLLNEHIAAGHARVLETLVDSDGITVLAGGVVGGVAPAPTLLQTSATRLLADSESLLVECFGPTGILVTYANEDELLSVAETFKGQLTATVQGEAGDEVGAALVRIVERAVGRVIWNGWPTGVSVTWAMHHGGPYPATTSPGFTSVGATAIERFLRPVAYQGVPDEVLPPELRDETRSSVARRIDGKLQLPG